METLGGRRRAARLAWRRGGRLAAALGILLPLVFACSRRADMNIPPPLALSSAALERLRTTKVFFGHQSVGNDIVAGIEELIGGYDPPVTRIVETTDPGAFSDGPLFAHAGVGANTKPGSKIEHFESIVSGGVGDAADVAFFKFCYIDLGAPDDPGALFEQYRAAMDRLQAAFPSVRIAHVTMPLRVVQTGPRVWVKRVIGRPIGGHADNIARNRYNALLREAYGRTGTLFDLARVQSTGISGRCTFASGAERFEALCPEHTSDGGHLNREGRRIAAWELLEFLGSPGLHGS